MCMIEYLYQFFLNFSSAQSLYNPNVKTLTKYDYKYERMHLWRTSFIFLQFLPGSKYTFHKFKENKSFLYLLSRRSIKKYRYFFTISKVCKGTFRGGL